MPCLLLNDLSVMQRLLFINPLLLNQVVTQTFYIKQLQIQFHFFYVNSFPSICLDQTTYEKSSPFYYFTIHKQNFNYVMYVIVHTSDDIK